MPGQGDKEPPLRRARRAQRTTDLAGERETCAVHASAVGIRAGADRVGARSAADRVGVDHVA